MPSAEEIYERADFTGGFSNSSLLVISLMGFTLLFALLAFLCHAAPSDEDLNEDEKDGVSYDQLLQEADICTLNRVQRRARARLLMKKNRRLPVQDQPGMNREGGEAAAAGEGEGGQPLLLGGGEGEHEANTEPIIPSGPKLSRKERQNAAKVLEQLERKADKEQNRLKMKQYEEERIIREQLTSEKKDRIEREKKEHVEKEFQGWKFMFPPSDDGDSDDPSVTVNDFVKELMNQPVIGLQETATRFSVSVPALIQRLKDLEEDGRICHGILNEDRDEYTFIDIECMEKITRFIKDEGCVSMQAISLKLAEIIEEK